MTTADAIKALNLAELAGRSVDEARAVVEAAGGIVRVIAPIGILTMEYVATRITLVAENGVVQRAQGPG